MNVYDLWLSPLSFVLTLQVSTAIFHPLEDLSSLPFVDSLAVTPLSLVT